ncbi:hypothetical protein PZA11_006973 [Diplocarpon coronariae]
MSTMASQSSSTSPGGSSGGNDPAAAAAMAAILKLMAKQKVKSEEAVQYFAIGISALMILFTIFHWSRFLYSQRVSKNMKKSGLLHAQVSIARMARHVLIHRVPGFTSMGHAVLVTCYLTINIVCLFTNMQYDDLMPFSKRMGWMAIGNIALVTFLALKNTPLAFLTAYSYERLNILHQIAGYTTVLLILLHGILISNAYINAGLRYMLEETTTAHGITAGVAAFVSMLFATFIRRIRYEVFYVSHVLMYMVLIISVGLHQPTLSNNIAIVTILAGGMWSSDRIIRACRLLWYSYDNRVTITPLPHGGTRVVLSRSPSRAVPGTHCFLWIPQIRLIETHPFTIVSSSKTSLTLVVSAHSGFTDDLYKYALQNSGTSLRASIEGPYGAIPNFSKVADKLILIAGGSGASFTFAVALDTLNKLADKPNTTIDFIWTVREQEILSWFREELAQLRASGRVNIRLHATQPSYRSSRGSLADDVTEVASPSSYRDIEKELASAGSPDSFPLDTRNNSVASHAGGIASPTDPLDKHGKSLAVRPGRPDVNAIIWDVVSKAGDNDRVAIAACGPDQLMSSVRNTTANCITNKGPSIELHLEQFGW